MDTEWVGGKPLLRDSTVDVGQVIQWHITATQRLSVIFEKNAIRKALPEGDAVHLFLSVL